MRSPLADPGPIPPTGAGPPSWPAAGGGSDSDRRHLRPFRTARALIVPTPVAAIRPPGRRSAAAGPGRPGLIAAGRFVAGVLPNEAAALHGGSRYREELGQLRRQLLLFRQQVAAGESPGSLTRSFGEIEDLNRRLGERARSESRIFRGDARLDTRALEAASQAVEKLRELDAEGRGARPAARSVGCSASTGQGHFRPFGIIREQPGDPDLGEVSGEIAATGGSPCRPAWGCPVPPGRRRCRAATMLAVPARR